jgi:hypothetical protein
MRDCKLESGSKLFLNEKVKDVQRYVFSLKTLRKENDIIDDLSVVKSCYFAGMVPLYQRHLKSCHFEDV